MHNDAICRINAFLTIKIKSFIVVRFYKCTVHATLICFPIYTSRDFRRMASDQ